MQFCVPEEQNRVVGDSRSRARMDSFCHFTYCKGCLCMQTVTGTYVMHDFITDLPIQWSQASDPLGNMCLHSDNGRGLQQQGDRTASMHRFRT